MERAGPPTYFQPLREGHVVYADGAVISILQEKFIHSYLLLLLLFGGGGGGGGNNFEMSCISTPGSHVRESEAIREPDVDAVLCCCSPYPPQGSKFCAC